MASHPIIWVLTSPSMLIYMGMIQGALRIWIYIYLGALKRFIKEVFVQGYGISFPRGSKNLRLYTILIITSTFEWLNTPRIYSSFLCTPILCSILMLLFYQFYLQLVRYIHIRILPQSYHDIVVFMYDLYFSPSRFSNFPIHLRHP